jgi:HEPN domain-containing protein
MLNADKQSGFWLESAREDWEVAGELVAKGRTRHGLFFAHLAMEKALKAHVCRSTDDTPPRTHDLLRLAELSGVAFEEDRKGLLAEFGRYQIEGRYPESLEPPPSRAEAEDELARAKEIFNWLTAK